MSLGTRLGSIGELIYLYISILLLLFVVLDLPTTAPGWPNVSVGLHDNKARVDPAFIPCQSSQTGSEPEDIGDPTTSTGEELARVELGHHIVLVIAYHSISQYTTVYHSTLQHFTVYITVYFTLHSILSLLLALFPGSSIPQYVTLLLGNKGTLQYYHSLLLFSQGGS